MTSRIFRPWEIEKLRASFKDEYRILLDVQILTGLRYKDLVKLQEHREWFNTGFLELPKNRIVELSTLGRILVPLILTANAPRYPKADTWDEMIRTAAYRAGIDAIGINATSLHKTYKAWQDFYYHEDKLTKGYFTEEDRKTMAKWVEGMIR